MLKKICEECGTTVRIDERIYEPGTVIYKSCPRCTATLEVEIPGTAKPKKTEVNQETSKEESLASNISNQQEATPQEITPPKIVTQEIAPQDATPKRKRTSKPRNPSNRKPGASSSKRSVQKPTSTPITIIEGSANRQHPKPVGCANWMILLVLALIIIASIVIYKSCSGSDSNDSDNNSGQVVAVDSDTVAAEEVVTVEEIPAEDTAIAESETAETVTSNYDMGLLSGTNYFEGNMIHTDGQKFPFTLRFHYNPDNGEISNIAYTNTGSGTKLKLECTYFGESQIRLEGMDGKKDFILEFSGDNPYVGDAWWGDFHQDIELSLTN